MVLNDHRLNVREQAEFTGISKRAIHRILHANLEMKKLCAKWLPHWLTIEPKQRPEDVSIVFESMFHGNKAEFLC